MSSVSIFGEAKDTKKLIEGVERKLVSFLEREDFI